MTNENQPSAENSSGWARQLGLSWTVNGFSSCAQERYADLPVEIRLQDYRDVRETFDHVVSVGMFEHVGLKNYRTYMETVSRCLSPEGCFLLHTIGRNRSGADFDPGSRSTSSPTTCSYAPGPSEPTTTSSGRSSSRIRAAAAPTPRSGSRHRGERRGLRVRHGRRQGEPTAAAGRRLEGEHAVGEDTVAAWGDRD